MLDLNLSIGVSNWNGGGLVTKELFPGKEKQNLEAQRIIAPPPQQKEQAMKKSRRGPRSRSNEHFQTALGTSNPSALRETVRTHV